MGFLKKLEIELPYDLAIPLLGIHTKETRIERDICTPVFITVLFTIARTWKQPRCPLADEWIRKLWYIYTMKYSVQFSCSVVSNSLQPHELQHARPPCPSPTPGVHSNSAIKKNAFESVLMRWMKLEPIVQSEVSQKEKHQYSILTHIHGI